jgi:hypothetical protein
VFVNAGRKRLNKSSLRLISEPSGSRIFSKGDKVEVVNTRSDYFGFVGSVEKVTKDCVWMTHESRTVQVNKKKASLRLIQANCS